MQNQQWAIEGRFMLILHQSRVGSQLMTRSYLKIHNDSYLKIFYWFLMNTGKIAKEKVNLRRHSKLVKDLKN